VIRSLLGIVLGVVARLWLATLRMQLVVHPELARYADVPWVLSFFHGTQWPLLAWRRRRPTLVMVSHSADGAMQARALGLLGFRVVRGSSSRGGARGLAAIVRAMRRGGVDAAFAVDGPRGPYGEVKPGAALAAAHAGGVLVPMGSAVEGGRTFTRAWDRFVLAWPFARVTVVLGAPVEASEAGEAGEALQDAIATANATAAVTLAGSSRKIAALQEVSASTGVGSAALAETAAVFDAVLDRIE
jgi:lysophospholipid acyltransferase (LPLAT)-like uncharacterized protein